MINRSLGQLGWIPYLNLVPLYTELRRLAGGSLDLVSGHPSTVSRWLLDGAVQVAPASSITLLKAKHLRLAMPLGIASDGPVQSVYIGLHREHAEFFDFVRSRQAILTSRFSTAMREFESDPQRVALSVVSSSREERPDLNIPLIKLTPASAASAALTETLLYLWCGYDTGLKILAQRRGARLDSSSEPTIGDRPMELVIGDEALQRRYEFWRVLDLGQIWRELTGLPFVFGLWQSNVSELPSGLIDLVTEAAAIAQARMTVEPQAYFPDLLPKCGDGAPVDLKSYWSVIQYKLTKRHYLSLLLYFHLYLQTSNAVDDDQSTDRLVTFKRGWSFDESGLSV